MRYLILVLALSLAGCDTLFVKADVPVSQSLPPAAQEAQTAINEANILITATANVIAENVKAGIMTRLEGQKYVTKLKDYAQQVDNAQALVRTGDIFNAKTQAELLKKALLALHKEVAARARKE